MKGVVLMNLIFLGDVVGKGGRNAVRQHLPELRRIYNAQFAIVNGENSAAGNGLTGSCVKELLEVADVITCGDHVWDQKGFENEIHLYPQVVRPANLSDLQPGKGCGIYRNFLIHIQIRSLFHTTVYQKILISKGNKVTTSCNLMSRAQEF